MEYHCIIIELWDVIVYTCITGLRNKVHRSKLRCIHRLEINSSGIFKGMILVIVMRTAEMRLSWQLKCYLFLFFPAFCKFPVTVAESSKGLKVLTILTGKNLYFTEFSTKIHWNLRLAASDVFICSYNQLSSSNSIIAQMSEKRHSSNRQ